MKVNFFGEELAWGYLNQMAHLFITELFLEHVNYMFCEGEILGDKLACMLFAGVHSVPIVTVQFGLEVSEKGLLIIRNARNVL